MVKYALVRLDTQVGIRRFEDPKDTIQRGQKLPKEFQNMLFGPNEWVVQETLSPQTTAVLEGIALISGQKAAQDLLLEVFRTGQTAVPEYA